MVNNGSVVIYYGVDGVMRFPTGVKISKAKNNARKFTEWDYKNKIIRNNVKNSTKSNKIIKDWLNKADDLISDYLLKGIKITAKELEVELYNIKNGKAIKINTFFMSNYLDFMEKKRVQLIERENKSDISFVTYQTFRSTIEDFEVEQGVLLKISDVANHDWLSGFHTWLTSKRPKEIIIDDKIYKFKTKGNLKPKSVKKRFVVLSSFFSELKENNLVNDFEFLKTYKRHEITVTNKIKTTLSIAEIHKLYNFKFEDSAKEKVKLLFLFSCLTGFRWKDIETFNRNFISELKGRKVYKHIASKTRNRNNKIATIPLCDLAIKILEELNYNLLIFSNGYTNRILHKLLQETKLFNDDSFEQDNKTGKLLKRHELLSMHRGRDTFITNLISTVPLNELMSYTSHEKLSTLQTYIDGSRDVNPEFVTIFDKKI